MSLVSVRHFLTEFIFFGLKQASACLFGGAMLFGILATKFLWQPDFLIPRYDALVFYALGIQLLFVLLKLESWEEMRVIFVFHVVGTVMELFKTQVGSWSYPEPSYLRIMTVPLFSGFMYSAVGSYIARAWRIFQYEFTRFPPTWLMVTLCVLIYVNFFTHHYVYDFRYFLFMLSAYVFGRTTIYYKPRETYYWMPALFAAFLVALFIWFAENMGTLTKTWLYPNQHLGWHLVSIEKIGSWFLLMIISFVLVALVHNKKDDTHSLTPAH